MSEIILILVVALVFLGPRKLPELASGLGKMIREVRKATADIKSEIELDETIRKPLEELREATMLPPEELKRRDLERIARAQWEKEEQERQEREAKEQAEQAAKDAAAAAPPAEKTIAMESPPVEAPTPPPALAMPKKMGSGLTDGTILGTPPPIGTVPAKPLTSNPSGPPPGPSRLPPPGLAGRSLPAPPPPV